MADENTQPNAQATEQPNTATRPDWVPEKFWNAETGSANTEALAKSYVELEKRLSSSKQPSNPLSIEMPKVNLFEKYSDALASGELSDDITADFESIGVTKEALSLIVEGKQARAAKAQTDLVSKAGIKDFNAVKAWAAENLTNAELDKFNKGVASGPESAEIALAWLNTKYNESKEPTNVSGGNATKTGSLEGFTSRAEYVKAASDPRMNKDKAYTNEVMERLKNRTY